jgi:hypothetical protein
MRVGEMAKAPLEWKQSEIEIKCRKIFLPARNQLWRIMTTLFDLNFLIAGCSVFRELGIGLRCYRKIKSFMQSKLNGVDVACCGHWDLN